MNSHNFLLFILIKFVDVRNCLYQRTWLALRSICEYIFCSCYTTLAVVHTTLQLSGHSSYSQTQKKPFQEAPLHCGSRHGVPDRHPAVDSRQKIKKPPS